MTHNYRDLTIGEAIGLIKTIRSGIDLYTYNKRYQKIVGFIVELEQDLAKVQGSGFTKTILAHVLDQLVLDELDADLEVWQNNLELFYLGMEDLSLMAHVPLAIGQSWEPKILFWSDLFQLWDTVIIDWEHHLAGFCRAASVDTSDEFLRDAFEISAEPKIYHLVRMKVDLLLNKVRVFPDLVYGRI